MTVKFCNAIAGLILVLLLSGSGLALSGAAQAQDTDPVPSFSEATALSKMPKLNAFSATTGGMTAPAALKKVTLEAKLTADGADMQTGLTWRIFRPYPNAEGKLPMLATAEGGSASFELPPGDYFVNVAFGRAGATKKLQIPESGEAEPQVLVLDAGGLKLNAVSGENQRIPPDDLGFTIYGTDVQEDGERRLVMDDVKPGTVVRLNAGTYHVVSDYGSVNAVIRADIQVEAGKITDAVIQHRAAHVNLKLVSQQGGEALADTAWSIVTSSGDMVSESVGAFPSMVLAEGDYTAIARHKEKNYTRDFKVRAGTNADVEVLLNN